MNKYLTEFNLTGNCIVNVPLICKDWNERFLIGTWINDDEEKYTFIVNGKRKGNVLCKTGISKEQANELILNLRLIHVKSSLFRSAGTYHKMEFIKSEIDRITEVKHQKEAELNHIMQALYQYQKCL